MLFRAGHIETFLVRVLADAVKSRLDEVVLDHEGGEWSHKSFPKRRWRQHDLRPLRLCASMQWFVTEFAAA